MRVAVIDLGTNTFNLLIADVHTNGFSVLHNSKEGVALGMGGINQGCISEDAMQRAFLAFEKFLPIIQNLHVENIAAIGTSAIRDAKNKDSFCDLIAKHYHIKIEVINGEQEAKLIYDGIRWLNTFEKPSLIMDIGGGSTEFIRVEGDFMQIVSENIGVARIFQFFRFNDPFSESDKNQVFDWLEHQAKEFQTFKPCPILIGASGSFETFHEMIYHLPFPLHEEKVLKREEIVKSLDWIIDSTQVERDNNPHIIPIRKKMAPIAALKTKWVIEKMQIQEVHISPYSLKEGVLRRFIS